MSLPEDELLPDARTFVYSLVSRTEWRTDKETCGKVITALQRHFRIGYTRACRLLETIQEREEWEK